jgi:plasmid stabilization system protein ParE
MRVIIEDSAIADIDALAAWIAKDSPQSARLTVEKDFAHDRATGTVPRRWGIGEMEGSFERSVPGTPYIAVYEVRKRPSAVLVIAVVHGARDR